MKICIIIGTIVHWECMAYLFEIYKNEEIDLYTGYPHGGRADVFKHLHYYKTLYKYNLMPIPFNLPIEKLDTYDFCFKVNAPDMCIQHKKIISIIHIINGKEQRSGKLKSKHFLALCPYAPFQKKNIHYTFPVFRPHLKETFSKMITMVGYYLQDSFDENTLKFIQDNSDYTFNFVIWGSKNYNKLKKIKNIKLYHKINNIDLAEIITNSKYMLSKKVIKRDRFSGQLGLAISFEKPMIIDKKTKDAYNLPGLEFTKDYTEIGKLANITDDKYNALVEEIRKFKDETIEKNRATINALKEET